MLQATVIYYPCSPIMPGHIAINLYNTDSKKSYFFDWGGRHNIKRNMEQYGNPIYIRLPMTFTSWTEIQKNKAKDPYFFEKSNGGGLEEQFYHLLSNNCAHAVQQILHISYLNKNKKPKKIVGLLPYVVAQDACLLALNIHDQERQKTLTCNLNEIEKVRALLQNSIQRLKYEIQHQKVNLIPFGINAKLYQIEQLNNYLHKIRRKNSLNKKNIIALIQLQNQVDNRTRTQLLETISKIEPGKVAYARIHRAANILKAKAAGLKTRGFDEAHEAAMYLSNILKFESNILFSKSYRPSQQKLLTFQRNCFAAYRKKQPILNKHRGFPLILAEIAISLVTLLGLGHYFHYKRTHQIGFFKTSTLSKAIHAKTTVEEVTSQLQQFILCR